VAAAPSNDSHLEPQYGHAPAPFPAPFPAPAPTPHPEAGGIQRPHVDTVSSDDSSEAHQEHFNSDVAGDNLQDQPLFTYDLGYDAANARGQDESDPYQGISLEQNFQNNPPPGHNKQSSISSLNFEVMGGGPAPQNQFAFHHEEEEQDLGGAEVPPAASLEEIEHLKHRAKEADDLARDSETTLRQLMAKADELRQAADNAELEARQRLAEASEKKKGGFMGGGKKKKSMVSVFNLFVSFGSPRMWDHFDHLGCVSVHRKKQPRRRLTLKQRKRCSLRPSRVRMMLKLLPWRPNERLISCGKRLKSLRLMRQQQLPWKSSQHQRLSLPTDIKTRGLTPSRRVMASLRQQLTAMVAMTKILATEESTTLQ